MELSNAKQNFKKYYLDHKLNTFSRLERNRKIYKLLLNIRILVIQNKNIEL